MIRKKYQKHGLTGTSLYSKWEGMLQRTTNPKAPGYRFYGERGIRVCDEWRSDFKEFYNWAIVNGYKDELEIDRRNGNMDYCPDNCRFVTKSENSKNVRRNLNWGIIKMYNGKVRVQVQRDGTIYRLGTYVDVNEARIERDKFVRGERGPKTYRPDKGIYKSRSGKFVVHVVSKRKCYHVGTYETVDEAIRMRDNFTQTA